MNKIKLSINGKQLVQSLPFAFTETTGFLAEAMQNARRSGATEVRFSTHPSEDNRYLQIEDNGNGIGDMEDLLKVASSGWPADIIEKETPFGLGFLSLLFNCESMVIESGGRCLTFNCQDVLAFKEVTVTRTERRTGTLIRMNNVSIPDQDPTFTVGIQRALRHYARGFPLTVSLNGEIFNRDHALDQLSSYEETTMGQMLIPGLSDEGPFTYGIQMRVYLQGLLVYKNTAADTPIIIHLDASRYQARLPDRDKLVDQDHVINEIKSVLSMLWENDINARLAAGEDINDHQIRSTIIDMHLYHIYNRLTYLPLIAMRWVASQPYRDVDECPAQPFLSTGKGIGRLITHQELKEGTVQLFKQENFTEETAIGWLMMYGNPNWRFIEDHFLDREHWALPYVQTISELPSSAIPVGVTQSAFFQGQVVEATVVFCENVKLTLGNYVKIINNTGVALKDLSETNHVIYIPRDVNDGGVVSQLCDFYDDEEGDVNLYLKDQEESAFANFIQLHRGVSSATVLEQQLEKKDILLNDLDGRYIITIHEGKLMVEENQEDHNETDC